MRTKLRRVILVLTLAILGGVVPASAHNVYEEDFVWESNGKCENVNSQIRERGKDPNATPGFNIYERTNMEKRGTIYTPAPVTVDCAVDWFMAPHYIKVQGLVYYKTCSGCARVYCSVASHGWRSNTSNNYFMAFSKDSAPAGCGAARYYENEGWGMHYESGTWLGGPIRSGFHYIVK